MKATRCGGCGAPDHVEADCPLYAGLEGEVARPTPRRADEQPLHIDASTLAAEVDAWERERDSRK